MALDRFFPSLIGYPTDRELDWRFWSMGAQFGNGPAIDHERFNMDLGSPKFLPCDPFEMNFSDNPFQSLTDYPIDQDLLFWCSSVESLAAQLGKGPASDHECFKMDSESVTCLPGDPFEMNPYAELLPRDPFEMEVETSTNAAISDQVSTLTDTVPTLSSPMISDESVASDALSEMGVPSSSAPVSTIVQALQGWEFVLGRLSVRDLLSVEQVCKYLNEAVRKNPQGPPLWMSIRIDENLRDRINNETLLKLTRRAQGNLRSLSMDSCLNVTDEGLRRVLEENPLLTKLYVPDCVKLTLDGLISNLKSFNSKNKPGIKYLKLGRLFRISESQYNELTALLSANSRHSSVQPEPHFYHLARSSERCNEDRTFDIDLCPGCQKLKPVYDCPLESCKGKRDACRACETCIYRCLHCGKCINKDGTYDETFTFEYRCGICMLQYAG